MCLIVNKLFITNVCVVTTVPLGTSITFNF